jgi:hypothetical protein
METETTKDANIKETESKSLIGLWTCLIILGLLVEFFGRLLGNPINPFSVHIPAASFFVALLAVVLILVGAINFRTGRKLQISSKLRNGLMMIFMGALMMLGFYAFRFAVPYIFG